MKLHKRCEKITFKLIQFEKILFNDQLIERDIIIIKVIVS